MSGQSNVPERLFPGACVCLHLQTAALHSASAALSPAVPEETNAAEERHEKAPAFKDLKRERERERERGRERQRERERERAVVIQGQGVR